MAVNRPQGSASVRWEEMNEMERLRRRDFLKLIVAGLALSGCAPRPVIDLPDPRLTSDGPDGRKLIACVASGGVICTWGLGRGSLNRAWGAAGAAVPRPRANAFLPI